MEATFKIEIDGLTEMQVHILRLIFAELEHADTKYHGDRMSPDELRCSFLTLQCEVKELEREIERKKKRPLAMQKEAIQTAAMAYKFCRDVAFFNSNEVLGEITGCG